MERPPVAVRHIPTTYSTEECYEKGLVLDLGSSVAWCQLGVVIGVVVNGQPYSAKVCYEKGLVHDPVSSGAWFLSWQYCEDALLDTGNYADGSQVYCKVNNGVHSGTWTHVASVVIQAGTEAKYYADGFSSVL